MANDDCVYIYTLSDPDSGRVRYVGKANNVSKRLSGHMRDSRKSNRPVCKWVAKLIVDGKSPVITTISTCTKDNWQEEERKQIALFRLSHDDLLNIADGGDQPGINIEANAENGRKNARRIHDDPVAKRIWTLKRNIPHALKFLEEVGDHERIEYLKCAMRYAAHKRPKDFGRWASV